MNNAQLGKIFGWGQFIFSTLGGALSHGLPSDIGGWIGLLGSLAAAIGIHSASNTDGIK